MKDLLKKHWKIYSIVLIAIIIGFLLYLRTRGYVWARGTGFLGKTLWDWMELLVIPVVLGFGALFFNRQERQNERTIAEERHNNDILQNYLDKMNELILEKGLMEVRRVRNQVKKDNTDASEEELEQAIPEELKAVRDMAQVRTVTVLRQLDTARKNIVFQFLRDADLAEFILIFASLPRADLAHTNMAKINLHGSNLFEANLFGAFLSQANLSETDLRRADLRGAILIGAKLRRAHLVDPFLNEVNVKGANLSGADLSEAVVFEEHISKAILHETIMPDGSKRSNWKPFQPW